jgi:hypothetical protein
VQQGSSGPFGPSGTRAPIDSPGNVLGEFFSPGNVGQGTLGLMLGSHSGGKNNMSRSIW